MQRICRFEIISVSREENFLPCSTEWDKSVYFTPSNHTITADNGKNRKTSGNSERIGNFFLFLYTVSFLGTWSQWEHERTHQAIHPQRNGLQWNNRWVCSWVENKLNNRPRKRLGYLTPNEKFNSILTN